MERSLVLSPVDFVENFLAVRIQITSGLQYLYSKIVKRFKKDQEKVEAPVNSLKMQCHVQRDISISRFGLPTCRGVKDHGIEKKYRKIKDKRLKWRPGTVRTHCSGVVFPCCRLFSLVYDGNFKLFHNVNFIWTLNETVAPRTKFWTYMLFNLLVKCLTPNFAFTCTEFKSSFNVSSDFGVGRHDVSSEKGKNQTDPLFFHTGKVGNLFRLSRRRDKYMMMNFFLFFFFSAFTPLHLKSSEMHRIQASVYY